MAIYLGTPYDDTLMGWTGNDTLDGGYGNDTLIGGLGNDTLSGGDGSDRFVYTSNTTFSPVIFGVDVISDFVSGSDQIHLQRTIFPSLSSVGGTGFSVADEFAIVTTDAEAATSTADIVYNSVNGNLFYNSNGTAPGFGTGALFATLTGAPPLLATDFIIVDGDDYLDGGAGNNSLDGGLGNDSLNGGLGNDTLDGGYGGDDYLDGGEGDDYLVGGDGNDTLIGDFFYGGYGGDDYLVGGDGNDYLVGGADNDSLIGGAGNDSLIGGAGNDSVDAGNGNDSLIGGDGNDSLIGEDGNDSLIGEDGNDSLIGGAGNDTLMGGEGSDRFLYTSSTTFNPVNFGVDVISDFVSGSDQIHLQRAIFPSLSSVGGTGFSVADEFAIVTTDAEAATSTADIVYNSVNGNLFYNSNGTAPGFGTGALFATLTGAPPLLATDFIIVDGDDSLMGGQANDTLDGGAGNDSLVGDLGNDTLDGGAGNDSLDGGFGGDDSLDGGYGNDTLIGWNGDDSLMGGDGNDYLYGDFFYGGDGGDDSLDGGEGNDSLNGGNGNDSLDGGEGNDSLMGGEGNDSLMGGEGNDSLDGGNGNDTLMGGEGSDRFVYTSSTTFNPVIFGVDVISDFVSGSDQIHLQRAIFPSLSSVGGTGFSVADEFAIVTTDAEAATSTADIVYNSVNGNLFYNSNGTAPGFGTGALFATLTGAPPLLATDFIIVDGDDSLIGGQANDTIDGEVGNDFLYGGAGNDFLYGEVGNDSLYGGTGDDSLYGGTGDDSLDGGGGYFFGENGGDDYLNGGDGDDSLYGGEGNDSLYGGDGDDSLNGEAGNDSLNGGAGNDSLYGGEGNDSLDAGAGNDSLNGGAGNDSLNGGDGNDSLNGGDGSDTLDGGTGNDSLIGGEGSDRFVYSTSGTVFNPLSFGVDVITDFETGTDKIVLNKTTFNSISSPVGTGLSLLGEFALVTSDVDAAASTADIVYNSVNGNLFYNPNGSNPGFGTGTLLLTLTGAPPLLATDFMIEASPLQLYGGLGNDSLDGGDGNDSLVGGADNDTLIGGKGNDLLLGASNSLYAGYDGNDFLDGGDGDDTLDGQVGNDSLIGGEGSDRFVYSTSGTALNPFNLGVDVITDFETGTDKIVLDKTTFNSISSPVGTGLSVCGEFATVTSDVDAATSTADIVYNSVNGNLFYNPNGSNPGFGTGALLLTLTGTPALIATDFMIEASPLQLYSGLGNDSLVGGEGNDSLVDGAGNDTLIGGNGNDALSGGVGNDSLVGGAGNDSLVGGEGNDSLDGGAGNDTLVGGLGNDSLVGGLGSDRFVYSSEEYAPGNLVFGVDVIADFETGNDKIVLDVHNFGSLGSAVGTGLSMASEFAIVTSDADAASSIAEIVYNSVNGNLFYNPNGSHPGFGTGALFATLVDAPTFVATDIEIIHSYPIID